MRGEPKRGLPEPTRKASRKPKTLTKKRRRLLRWVVRLLVVWVLIVGVGSAAFIGTRCYSQSAPVGARLPPAAADGLPGYLRPEAFTYLTVPEWYIVYSADEYAAHIAQRPPSAFPYLGSVRQYWGYYASVCAITKRSYPFEAGYHAMLGIIGASFTLENSFRAVYENTIGRLTEALSSTDTAEDTFARRTATEYGAFMHTVPWYEFPFGSRLAAFWRETPLGGPHKLRKVERRFALTAEYGIKAVYGWLIAQASGSAYAPEDLRIHARIEHASDSLFKDSRVKPVRALGSGAYLVTLPRYEEFTKTALALNAQGVRFLDIAGNDEIVMTVLARRGSSQNIPGSTFLASGPILTDPTMQRLVLIAPVAGLREIAAHLARERAVIEHLYDY